MPVKVLHPNNIWFRRFLAFKKQVHIDRERRANQMIYRSKQEIQLPRAPRKSIGSDVIGCLIVAVIFVTLVFMAAGVEASR